MKRVRRKSFTGHHMAAILAGFFGVVIAVNIVMARVAIGSFGGTVVDNSYVASQKYNGWLAEAEKQARLGWTVGAARLADGRLGVTVADNGVAGTGFAVRAEARHPLGKAASRSLTFVAQGDGLYRARQPLPAGRWRLSIEISRGAERYRELVEIR